MEDEEIVEEVNEYEDDEENDQSQTVQDDTFSSTSSDES